MSIIGGIYLCLTMGLTCYSDCILDENNMVVYHVCFVLFIFLVYIYNFSFQCVFGYFDSLIVRELVPCVRP